MADPKKRRPKLGDAGRVPESGLEVIAWMVKLLGISAQQVVDSSLTEKGKRAELLAIADRMAKLRDDAAIHAALEQLRRGNQELSERAPGPELVDAPSIPTGAGPVTARRGRPPRSAIR